LVASCLGANSVTLTHQGSFGYPDGDNSSSAPKETLLDLLRVNVALNAKVSSTTVKVSEMLWGDALHLQRVGANGGTYDLICGADILLFTSAHIELLLTLRQLSNVSTVVLLEHTDRADNEQEFPPDLKLFLVAVAADGLWLPSIVKDHGRHITIRMVRTDVGDPPFGGALPRSSWL